MRLNKSAALVVALVLLYSTGVSAELSPYDSATNQGILDRVVSEFATRAAGWQSIILAAATRLYWTLVTISMVWTFGMMALRKADIGEFFAEFVRFTIFTGFFWWILINGPNFASSIYASLRQLAEEAIGISGISPSGIVNVGFAVWKQALVNLSMWKPIDSLVGLALSAGILLLLATIAINMLLLLVSGWILAYAGIFFLGFGGSRWTSDMAINYYKTVLGVAAQFMTMVLLVGIGNDLLSSFYGQMTKGQLNFDELGVMLVFCFTLMMLVNKIPALLSGIIAGTGIGHAGIGNFGAGAIVGAAMGAAGMAAAASATGREMIASGASSMAGGAQAVMAAFTKAGENVQAGSDLLTNMGGGHGAESAAIGTGNTPFAQAAGFGSASGVLGERPRSPDKTGADVGLFSTAAQSAGNMGKLVADAGANLAKGAFDVARDKASSLREASMDRIADTTGGKIAAAIKAQGSSDAPSFAADSLTGERPVDRESEVAAFANRDKPVA